MNVRTCEIIEAKRDGRELEPCQISSIVSGYASGEIPDYQMSAWLMAVCIRGMSSAETAALTQAMVDSGETLDLTSIPGFKVDKHSTGGVGDKTTLVLVPLLAAAGLKVAKMSGRGLGYTGGTLDKLESIPGMSVCLSRKHFVQQVRQVGAAISGQTADLVPADRKMYALRDVTGTVECIPLIAASIMSKKIAAGAETILLDVKAGCGAFMKTEEDARQLAGTMIEIGARLGRRVVAAITDMSQPLGRTIGNSLEVAEAIETLGGGGPSDLRELCLELGSVLIHAATGKERDEAKAYLACLLDSGAAAERFRDLLVAQGGDPRVVKSPSYLPAAEHVLNARSLKEGYVTAIDTAALGAAAMSLGAGRATKEDKIDVSAGIVVHKKLGDLVRQDETLAELHFSAEAYPQAAVERVSSAYRLEEAPPPRQPVILDFLQ